MEYWATETVQPGDVDIPVRSCYISTRWTLPYRIRQARKPEPLANLSDEAWARIQTEISAVSKCIEPPQSVVQGLFWMVSFMICYLLTFRLEKTLHFGIALLIAVVLQVVITIIGGLLVLFYLNKIDTARDAKIIQVCEKLSQEEVGVSGYHLEYHYKHIKEPVKFIRFSPPSTDTYGEEGTQPSSYPLEWQGKPARVARVELYTIMAVFGLLAGISMSAASRAIDRD